MPEPLTVISAYGTAGNFDGEAVGFLAVTATGAGLAADTMEFVSDVVAHEIDVADAADYVRTTAVGAVSTVGDDQVLGPAPAETPTFDLAGAPSVGGFWLYDPTTGVDATMALIGFLPQTAAAGLAVHTVNAPDGWVRWRRQPIDLEQRVTSLEDRTVPDAADGDPNQVWTTDGAAGSWQDVPGGVAPQEVVATSPTPGAIVVTVPAIDGTTYIVPDFAEASDFAFGASIPADGAGSFRLVVMPQTGAGATTAYFVAVSGVPLTKVEVGNPLPADLTPGAVLDFTSDGANDWQIATGRFDSDTFVSGLSTSFAFATQIANLPSQPRVNQGHDGGGVTSYLNTHRTGDPAGMYIAANPATNMTSSGTPYGGGMFTLMDQANGLNGAFHGFVMPVGLTYTMSTALRTIVINASDFIAPQPVAGDVIALDGESVAGHWINSNLRSGVDWSVGATQTWRSTTNGMSTNFVDITPAVTSVNGQTGVVVLDHTDVGAAPLTTAVAALTPTTGTVDLDLATVNGEYRTHALSGNVTYTSSNRAAGKSVTIKVLCDATPRTFTFPAWVFVGTEPTTIASGKTGILTVTWFGTADTDAVAAWSVEA